MNRQLEDLLRETFAEMADEAATPPYLADKALARRGLTRRFGLLAGVAATAACAVVGVVAVPAILGNAPTTNTPAAGGPTPSKEQNPFEVRQPLTVISFVAHRGDQRVVYYLDPLTERYRQAGTGTSLTSPDGRWLLVSGRTDLSTPPSRSGEPGSFRLLDTRTGDLASLSLPTDSYRPVWSPDNRYLLLTTGSKEQTRFAVYDTETRRLSTGPANRLPSDVSSFAWGPDGKVHTQRGNGEVLEFQRNGAYATESTHSYPWRLEGSIWSPAATDTVVRTESGQAGLVSLANEEQVKPLGIEYRNVVRWLDNDRLLIVVGSGRGAQLAVFSRQDGESTRQILPVSQLAGWAGAQSVDPTSVQVVSGADLSDQVRRSFSFRY